MEERKIARLLRRWREFWHIHDWKITPFIRENSHAYYLECRTCGHLILIPDVCAEGGDGNH